MKTKYPKTTPCFSQQLRALASVVAFLFAVVVYAQGPIEVAGTANKTAVQSGDWSSITTWGGSLPANDDRVLIPTGITVTVDGIISEEFKSIRIDNGGKLQFATNVNTELRTEYLVSGMMGTLEIGTNDAIVLPNIKASLVFAERGGTTSSFDPQRFAPGAVLMGTTTMHGANKTSWTTLATHPSAGASQFELKTTPTGWQVGDKLVVAGTDPITNASISSTEELGSDEVVTITAISGSTVSFTPALIRDHKAPAQAADLDVHIANLSRNVVISSENTSVESLSGDFRKPRGHMMFMHTLKVNLDYIEANNLGRTDKSIILDDWNFEDLARDPNTGRPIPGGGRNPRGRYSIHFHRGGLNTEVVPARPTTPLPTPARVEGCVVNNDPGWGFVNHSSRVDFIRNVSYDVVGGAFNTEAGNETGSFVENIAIRTINPQNPIMVAPRPRNSFIDADEPTSSLADGRENRQDFAWQGDGFWLHGTGVTVQGNVVAGCTGHAYVYWTDGLIEKGLGMARGDIDAHVPAAEFPTQNALLKDWKAKHPNFSFDIWYLQPRPFTNNTAYNFARGIQTYYVHTEFHQQNDRTIGGFEDTFNDLPPAYKDQLNLIFDGTTLWNIGRRGFSTEISTNITIQNSRIVGYNGRTGFENYGTNPNPTYVNNEPEVIGIDLSHYHNTHRWLLRNNTIEGFAGNSVGIALPLNGQATVSGGTFNNSGTDILVGCPSRNLSNEDGGFGIGMLATNPTASKVLIEGPISFQNPNNNIVMDAEIIFDEIPGEGFPLLNGAKEDETYFFAPQEVTLNFGPFANARAYFNEQDASHIPITSENRCAFSSAGEECVSNQYVGKTNTQLQSQYNKSFAGSVTPATAVTHSILVGGKVDAVFTPPTSCPFSDTNPTFSISTANETCAGKNNGSITINGFTNVAHTAVINSTEYQFTENTTIANLAPGNYQICVRVDEFPNCERCFETVITGGVTLNGSTAFVAATSLKGNLAVALEKGTAPYTVAINNQFYGEYTTKTFSVPVTAGDQVSVSTAKSCEGTLDWNTSTAHFMSLYPNPTTAMVQINLAGITDNTVAIAVMDATGKCVLQTAANNNGGAATVDISQVPPGLYLIKINTAKQQQTFKVIKK